MARSKKAVAKNIAATGARTVWGAVSLCLKTLGTILLIAVTTGIIFASIFAVYVKTNLSSGVDITLENFKLGLSSVILGQNSETGEWQELVTLQSTEYRIWVDYENIPKNMEHALISIEDERFYRHNGVDWYRTSGAFVNMFLGMKDNFGGSTITQQLIKNVTQEDEVTVQRKLMEIFKALELEKEYKKDKILEWYLSVVYFGHGRYGVGAASNYYFGKDVSELSLAECASIIGITNNPSIYSPYVSRENNKDRQELILKQMCKQEYITEQERDRAIKEKLVFRRGEDEKFEPVIYSWFEEAVIEEVVQDLVEQKGFSTKAARTYLNNGGFKIYSTVDLSIQEQMDSVYKNLDEIPVVTGSSQQIQSAMIIADPYTGDIVAIAGGVGEKRENLLRSNATRARRPPGSSIKPLAVYAPAMENGIITPDTKFEDSHNIILAGRTDGWMPHNDDGSSSGAIMSIRNAVIRSKNTISAQVLDLLTPSVSYQFMTQRLGFKLDAEDENYAALSLGQLNHGATVKEMTSAYTMFNNAGVRTELRTYSKVTDADGNVILEKKPKQIVAISETTAYWMTDMLRQAATNGTGYEANLGKMPTAGKTGTTTDKKDRWFAGYTPYYVGVVWTGYEYPAVMKVQNGGNPASQIWKKVMSKVHENLEPKEFNKPSNTYQPPVEGVQEVGYTIRYVDTDGNLISVEEQLGVIDREVTAVAMPLPDYVLISEPEKRITLGENPGKNVIEFIYKKDEPEPDPDPDPFDPWWQENDPDVSEPPWDGTWNPPWDGTWDWDPPYPGDTHDTDDTAESDEPSDGDGPIVG